MYAAIQFAVGIPTLMVIRYAILLQLHFYKRNYIKKHKTLKKSPSFTSTNTDTDSSIGSAATVTTNLSARSKSKLQLYYQESTFLGKVWKKLRDLLTLLKSPWIFVSVPIIWVSFYLSIIFIIFAIGGLRCSPFSRTYIRLAHIGLLLVYLIVIILFVLLDFLLSLRRCFK